MAIKQNPLTDTTIDGTSTTTTDKAPVGTRSAESIVKQFEKDFAEYAKSGIRLNQIIGNISPELEHLLVSKHPLLVIVRQPFGLKFLLSNGKSFDYKE